MNPKRKSLPPKFFRRKRSSCVYYRVDKAHYVSTGLTEPSNTELYLWLTKWDEEQKTLKSGYETWPAARLFPLFVDAKKSQRRQPAKSTIVGYHRAVHHLAKEKWWATIPLKDINTEVALTYLAGHRNAKYEPERDIRFLKQLKRWCIQTEKFDAREIFVSTPVGTDSTDPVGRAISKDEDDRLRVEVARSKTKHAILIYDLTLLRGFRQQEIQKLKVGWIIWKEKLVALPGEYTKTRQPREVPIPEHLIPALKEMCKGKGPDDGVFTDRPINSDNRLHLGQWWNLAKLRAKVKCRFHDLRVTCCTRMAEAGVPQAYAEDILGHDAEVRRLYVKILSRSKKRDVMKDYDKQQ